MAVENEEDAQIVINCTKEHQETEKLSTVTSGGLTDQSISGLPRELKIQYADFTNFTVRRP